MLGTTFHQAINCSGLQQPLIFCALAFKAFRG